ncbi:hypothetical protein BY458DRAFT_558376 [Sporodiniella umbellata]|nr:hypothetical protein BY458DRAFT_558376 [Sporodiniella umbellata]
MSSVHLGPSISKRPHFGKKSPFMHEKRSKLVYSSSNNVTWSRIKPLSSKGKTPADAIYSHPPKTSKRPMACDFSHIQDMALFREIALIEQISLEETFDSPLECHFTTCQSPILESSVMSLIRSHLSDASRQAEKEIEDELDTSRQHMLKSLIPHPNIIFK